MLCVVLSNHYYYIIRSHLYFFHVGSLWHLINIIYQMASGAMAIVDLMECQSNCEFYENKKCDGIRDGMLSPRLLHKSTHTNVHLHWALDFIRMLSI